MLMSYDLMKCSYVFRNTTVNSIKKNPLEYLENILKEQKLIILHFDSQSFSCLQDI